MNVEAGVTVAVLLAGVAGVALGVVVYEIGRRLLRCGTLLRPHHPIHLHPVPDDEYHRSLTGHALVARAKRWRGPMPEGSVITPIVCGRCGRISRSFNMVTMS